MSRFYLIAAVTLAVLTGGPSNAAPQSNTNTTYRIGFLTAVAPVKAFRLRLASLKKGLRDLGYVEGKNFILDARFARGQRESLPKLATELVRLEPHVVITHGDTIAKIVDKVARAAGKNIPIVLAVSSDPVKGGVVASLARPGGNVTGLTSNSGDLTAKRLALLKEMAPAVSRIAVLWDPRIRSTERQLKIVKSLAPALGVTVVPIEFRKPYTHRAFNEVGNEHVDALMVLAWGSSRPFARQIADFAFVNRLPTIFPAESFVVAGGLMSYGADSFDMYRRAATFVHKILKGKKPADLPVEQPSRFKLTINYKTAKVLGIEVPASILLRSDEVLE